MSGNDASLNPDEAVTSKRSGLRDRTFARVFSNLSVYSLLYEDSEVDDRFLGIGEGSTILGITGAGCRIAGHVSRHPRSIDAVDINRHHLALTALKASAVRHVAQPSALHTIFGDVPGADPRPLLGKAINTLPGWLRDYWKKREGLLEHGLLGRGLTARMVGVLRLLAGVDEKFLRDLIAMPISERLASLEKRFGPILYRRDVSAILKSPLALLALGVNYAQRDRILSAEQMDFVSFLMQHIRRVASTDLAKNWFVWFAFTGRFNAEDQEALPPYLREDRVAQANRSPTAVRYHHRNLFEVLEGGGRETWSHYELCDAPDWMPQPVQKRLLDEILRTSRDGGVLQYRSVEPTSIVQRLGLERHFQRLEVSDEATALDRTCQYRAVNLYRIVH